MHTFGIKLAANAANDSASFKRLIQVSLVVSFVLVGGLYHLTLFRPDGHDQRPLAFGENTVLFIAETSGINTFQAGGPFSSTYSYDARGSGCPCQGVLKPLIIFPMIFTWEFVANLLLWTLPVTGIAYIISKYENLRH